MAKYRISCALDFIAIHSAPKSGDHNQRQLHGHNWQAVFSFDFDATNDFGMTEDQELLRTRLLEMLPNYKNLDHLIPGGATAENIAKHLFEKAKKVFCNLKCVELKEPPNFSVQYWD